MTATGTADFSEQGGLSVSVEQDYQSTVDAVKSFVEDYNTLIEKLNTLYYETKYSDYQPLTDEQRAEMTEKEQELWDEKARSGILRNDSTIGNLITNLRSTLPVKVGDTGFSAFDLGITTTAWSTDSWRTEQGKLVLDEDALLAALKEDPNAVQEYFTQIATTEDGSADVTVTKSGFTQKSESGLFQRMNAILSNFNSTMRSQNIQSTKNKITSYEEKIRSTRCMKRKRAYGQNTVRSKPYYQNSSPNRITSLPCWEAPERMLTYEEFYGAALTQMKAAEKLLLGLAAQYPDTEQVMKSIIYCCSRLKSPDSMIRKLSARGLPATPQAAVHLPRTYTGS